MVRDESLSRTLMLICLLAAGLLLGARWRLAPQSASNIQPGATGQSPTHLQRQTASNQSQAKPGGTNAETASKLVVDLSERRVYVYRGKQVQKSYVVAIGQAGWETPVGNFRVGQLQQNPVWHHPITKVAVAPGPKNPLGARWIGFWSNNRYQIGFHGTNQEHLLGTAVSHGCLRMRNEDIVALYDRIAIGTPVQVQP